MSQYTKTQPRRQPKTPSSVTAEQRYWRSFKQPCVFTALNVVSRVRFCPADPRDLLITSGPRVHVYDPLQVRTGITGMHRARMSFDVFVTVSCSARRGTLYQFFATLRTRSFTLPR
jgi:hypothetical protein